MYTEVGDVSTERTQLCNNFINPTGLSLSKIAYRVRLCMYICRDKCACLYLASTFILYFFKKNSICGNCTIPSPKSLILVTGIELPTVNLDAELSAAGAWHFQPANQA
jgi:hypothetical protein